MRYIDKIKQLPRIHKYAILGVGILMGVIALLPQKNEAMSAHTTPQILESGIRYPLELRLDDESVLYGKVDVDDETWDSVTVKSGDTLGNIFKRLGLSAKETYLVTHADELAKTLVKLRPGEVLEFKTKEGKLNQLRYRLSAVKTLYVHANKDGNGFSTSLDEKKVELRTSFAQGEITSSFWNAAVKAGLTDNLIMRLAGIFGWDIDFAIELRQGDLFNVVFEEQYVDGEFIGYGNIVAAEFVNQGDIFQAIRHSDGNYYTPDGRSMRKSFLRAPVDFRYVSSNFTKARFHPVQKRWKAHRGTDYVAAIGTPVMAAGDGKVIRAGYDKYNGHHVFIQHGEKYTTKYLHFKKRAVKKGDTVKQGQTVGYLGNTGMVTGAHLHYEFLVDGVHRNPRTVSLPKALPIAKSEEQAFLEIAKQRIKELNTTKRFLIANLRDNSSKSL
jgi:murein DD-endopeptidase MepM/ murein hydrolase activator NlpD